MGKWEVAGGILYFLNLILFSKVTYKGFLFQINSVLLYFLFIKES